LGLGTLTICRILGTDFKCIHSNPVASILSLILRATSRTA